MASILRFCLLGVVLAYTVSPLAAIFVVSLSPGRMNVIADGPFSLHWYKEAIASGTVQEAFFTSAVVACVVAAASTALGFASVRFVRRLTPAWGLIVSVLIGLPALVPAFVSGFSLHVYYQFIRLDGTLLGIILTQIVYASPFAFFLLFLAQENLNPEHEECARNLGASEYQITLQIVLPQLVKACVSAMIICGLISWDEFVVTWFVSGFHKTLPTLVYGMLGNTLDPSLYAVGSMVTMVSLTLAVLAAVALKQQIIDGLARR